MADSFLVQILRQDRPDQASYWQTFRLEYEPGLNITSVLQRITARPTTDRGEHVAPVAFSCNCLEEVCGACTMVINGRVRQACSALVDRLLEDQPDRIELRPMGKFPIVRDLVVDRRRLFRALEKVQSWIPVDGYYDLGHGPPHSQEEQEHRYALSKCMSCGCCLEACPQYPRLEVTRAPGESLEQYQARRDQVFDHNFIGAHAMNQVVLMNSHPTGAMTAGTRIEALIAEGGIQDCGKAANCQAVCPQKIPLMDSWAKAGRAATVHAIKRFFDG